MNVTAERVGKIPIGNLHVSRQEFAEVWAQAETAVKRSAPDVEYLVGVVYTCRWLADQVVPSSAGGFDVPRSPVRRRQIRAMPETIEEEWLAAVRTQRNRVAGQAAVARGALATLDWAWHSNGRPPVGPVAAAG